jgi:hypothetical protein
MGRVKYRYAEFLPKTTSVPPRISIFHSIIDEYGDRTRNTDSREEEEMIQAITSSSSMATPIVGDDESDVSRTREISTSGVVDINYFEKCKSSPCSRVDILNRKKQKQPVREEEEMTQAMTSSSSKAASVVGDDDSDVSHAREFLLVSQ